MSGDPLGLYDYRPGDGNNALLQKILRAASSLSGVMIPEAPVDGQTYGRKNAGWVVVTGGGGASYTEVANYAALPAAAGVSGDTYLVRAAQGTYFVNRKPAGLYRSDGAAWNYLADATEAYFQDTLAWTNVTSKPFPNGAPAAGQVPVGNIGGTAFAYKTLTADVTIDSTGATTIALAAVTLAKMADLAQDQFIGRTTASTGVPQTATITAAARSVLDDASVGDMVNTLGGASAVGTGGLVREASPTFSGTITVTGAGGATIDNSSASDGTISSTGGGRFVISAGVKFTGAVTDSANGLGSAGQILKSNGSGVLTYGNNLGSYTLSFIAGSLTTVVDATTYYLGAVSGVALGTNQGRFRVYVPKTGTIKAAEIFTYASTAGSNENWDWGISVNNGAPTSIAVVAANTNNRRWSNTGLSIAVNAGDYIELVTTTPTWATNPATLNAAGTVYIETALT